MTRYEQPVAEALLRTQATGVSSYKALRLEGAEWP